VARAGRQSQAAASPVSFYTRRSRSQISVGSCFVSDTADMLLRSALSVAGLVLLVFAIAPYFGREKVE
jgi:hypothetical protein